MAKQEKQLGEDMSYSRSLFFILPSLFPCANCPSCEQGQLPAAFGGVEKKDTLAGTRCSSEPGVERGRKPIFFFSVMLQKMPSSATETRQGGGSLHL